VWRAALLGEVSGTDGEVTKATKTGVEHRIPLSKQAVELLEQIRTGRKTDIVFTGDKLGKSMSNGACSRWSSA
jgi:integrase